MDSRLGEMTGFIYYTHNPRSEAIVSNVSITSAEFQRAFGRYREAALKAPVTITNHGRDSLVLMAVDEYRRLKRRDRMALRTETLSDEEFQAITEQDLPADLARFDAELEP